MLDLRTSVCTKNSSELLKELLGLSHEERTAFVEQSLLDVDELDKRVSSEENAVTYIETILLLVLHTKCHSGQNVSLLDDYLDYVLVFYLTEVKRKQRFCELVRRAADSAFKEIVMNKLEVVRRKRPCTTSQPVKNSSDSRKRLASQEVYVRKPLGDVANDTQRGRKRTQTQQTQTFSVELTPAVHRTDAVFEEIQDTPVRRVRIQRQTVQ